MLFRSLPLAPPPVFLSFHVPAPPHPSRRPHLQRLGRALSRNAPNADPTPFPRPPAPAPISSDFCRTTFVLQPAESRGPGSCGPRPVPSEPSRLIMIPLNHPRKPPFEGASPAPLSRSPRETDRTMYSDVHHSLTSLAFHLEYRQRGVQDKHFRPKPA